jgi:hypothetical protein
VSFRDAGRHVALEPEHARPHTLAPRQGSHRALEPLGAPAHHGEVHVTNAGERPDDGPKGPDTESTARDQHAERLAGSGVRHIEDPLERRPHGDPGHVEPLGGERVSDRVDERARRGDAERIDALLGPHGVRAVVGDDAHEGAGEAPLATRPSEHEQRNVMRRDDSSRLELDDPLDQTRPREMIEPAPDRLERPVAVVRAEVRAAVERRNAALHREVRSDVRVAEDARRMLERVEQHDLEPAGARRLGDRESGCLVPSADG